MITHTHTTGPWVAHKYPTKRGYGFVIQSKQSRGISIASLSPGDTTDRIEPIAEANARLIAAAPDMLSALVRVEAVAHFYSKFDGVPAEIRDAFTAILDETAAALAKTKEA